MTTNPLSVATCPPRHGARNEPPFRLLEEKASASREISARNAVEESKNSTLEYLQFFVERSMKGICKLEEVRLHRACIRKSTNHTALAVRTVGDVPRTLPRHKRRTPETGGRNGSPFSFLAHA